MYIASYDLPLFGGTATEAQSREFFPGVDEQVAVGRVPNLHKVIKGGRRTAPCRQPCTLADPEHDD
jgi:hypothetical protein